MANKTQCPYEARALCEAESMAEVRRTKQAGTCGMNGSGGGTAPVTAVGVLAGLCRFVAR